MAGYSETPLAKKLGVKPGSRVALAGAPAGFETTLEPLPEGVRIERRVEPPVDVIVFFTCVLADLERELPALARALTPAGGLWVAWPKKASGVPTDLAFENVQRTGLDLGLVDNKVCAVDDVWSGLRFVYRLKDRPGGKR